MEKLIFIMLVLSLLVGCGKQPQTIQDGYYSKSDFSEHCIDGVVYLFRHAGHGKMLAPKFNKETKQVEVCNG